MSNESGFISGIFNYCDRWCERCAFVSRCRVGAAEQAHIGELGEVDLKNAAFWERLGQIFEDTKQLIMKMARERGIDLEQAMAQAAAGPDHRLSVGQAHRTVLRQAKLYFRNTEAWFQANGEVLEAKVQELMGVARMALPGVDPVADAARIKDALEVVRWYSPQIQVKLMRASHAEPEAKDDPELAEAARQDADGSAKVALIGMDRSLAAWGQLYEQLPDAQDGILDMLVHLDRLRRAAEQLFPNARAFVRPGFDDPTWRADKHRHCSTTTEVPLKR
jgi:hypothetical protein